MVVSLLATMIAAGIAGWLLFRYAMPEHYFRFYPVIPIYFTALGVVTSAAMRYYSKRKPKKIVAVYMMMRGVKLLLTLGTILAYYLATDGERMTEFALTTAVFYSLYLFVETYLFYRFEKMTKKMHG